MERRHLIFFATSFAIIMLWQIMFPRTPPVEPNPPAEAAQAEGDQAADDAAGDDQAAPSDPENSDGEEAAAVPPAIAERPPVDSPPFVTLGSLDPESPYRFLAAFNTRGATLQRLQLSSHEYRDLHDRSGFLGQLELADHPRGALVQLVGPGSPAAKAGLEAEDVLLGVELSGEGENQPAADLDLLTPEALATVLAESEPGDEAQLTIERGGEEQKLSATLIRRPLDLIRPEAENILLHSDALPDDFEHHPSLEIALRKIGPEEVAEADLAKANRELAKGLWQANSLSDDKLELTMLLPELQIEVIKRFTIAKTPEESQDERHYRAYHLDFEVEIRNLAASPQSVSYELQGPNGLPVEGWWYSNKVGRSWSGYGIRDVVMRIYNRGEKDFACRNIAKGDVDSYGDGESLAYMGVDAQYFAAALLPQKETTDTRWYAKFSPELASTLFDERNSYRQRYQNASFVLTSRTIELAPSGGQGASVSDICTLFTGPKHPSLLEQYTAAGTDDQSLTDFVYYGWFGSIGIPQAMVKILSFFYSIVRNYGLAIIMLTVLVRSCMFPLSRKQAKNMMKMQELKPEMDRIAARHKDDVQARTKAQQELWAKHNYNPMGGCLLMFVQFPIFIGLYRALMVDVDLRQASLIPGMRWCSNLAAPDMFLKWDWLWPTWFDNGEGILALGPYLNVLPLATVGLFLLQQKMFMPPPTDDQTRMMQKMMKYMMLFMSFMFFKVAAGLCLYFIASSLWGITERKLIPQPTRPEGEAAPATPLPKAKETKPSSQKTGNKSAHKRSGKNGKKGGKKKR